jgi:hypothetical protein
VGSLLRRLWAVRWENRAKEGFWRLVYDALPTPARLHAQGRPCQCQGGQGEAALPGREHCFWDCPVAGAVREQLQRALPPGAPPLTREQLWLARGPAGVLRGVWLVVVLAAVWAMDKGRMALTRWRLAARGGDPPPAALLPPAEQVTAAGRIAAAAFWEHLQDYVAGGEWADCWGEGSVAAPHPFIQRAASGVLAVIVPP